MDLKKRSGTEISVEKDPITGREIWRMTNSEAHDMHSYYDVCSWSPDNSKIAFSSATTTSNKEWDTGHIFSMDADGSNIRCVANNGLFNAHTGCYPIWQNDNNIVYRSISGTSVVNIDTLEIKTIPDVNGQKLSPDGNRLCCQELTNDGPAVTVVDLETLEKTQILKPEDVIPHIPEYDENYAEEPVIANIKWNPKMDKIMFRFNFKPGQYMKSLVLCNADGTDIKHLDALSSGFSHHSWHPDGERILYTDKDENGNNYYFLIDQDGTNRVQLSTQPLGAHPMINPAGTEIVDFTGYRIIHLDVDTKEVTELASYTRHLDDFMAENPNHHGYHAHPNWNRDGSQINYHSDHTGTSEMYVIPLK